MIDLILKQLEELGTAATERLVVLTEEDQVKILGHSLGVNVLHAKNSPKKKDRRLPKEFYRNRFCTSPGHDDLPVLAVLEDFGHMAQGAKINGGVDTLWYVTETGVEYFRTKFQEYVNNSEE